MQILNLYTLTTAAHRLGISRDQVWYAIRREIWRPRFMLGNAYVLDDKDLADLKAALVGARQLTKRRLGRFLREPDPEPIEPAIAENPESEKRTPGTRSPKTR